MRNVAVLCAALLCTGAYRGQAQPSAPLASVTMPDFTTFGVSYNQFASPQISGFISGLFADTQNKQSTLYGMYTGFTADFMPVKYTDPATGKHGYLFSANASAGQYKTLLDTNPQIAGEPFHKEFVAMIGVNAGAQLTTSSPTITITGSNTASSGTSSVSIGFSGSFAIPMFYRFAQHWAAGLTVRALYVSPVTPGASAAFNFVLAPGIVYCK